MKYHRISCVLLVALFMGQFAPQLENQIRHRLNRYNTRIRYRRNNREEWLEQPILETRRKRPND